MGRTGTAQSTRSASPTLLVTPRTTRRSIASNRTSTRSPCTTATKRATQLIDSSGNGYHVNLKEASTGNVSRIKVYDEANMSAADLLATGEYEWQVVEHLGDNINTAGQEHCGDISADGRTIVFSSGEEWKTQQLWSATRESPDSPWSEPQLIGNQINSAKLLTHPILSPDGLQLTYVRFRNSGGREILFVSRKSIDDSRV